MQTSFITPVYNHDDFLHVIEIAENSEYSLVISDIVQVEKKGPFKLGCVIILWKGDENNTYQILKRQHLVNATRVLNFEEEKNLEINTFGKVLKIDEIPDWSLLEKNTTDLEIFILEINRLNNKIRDIEDSIQRNNLQMQNCIRFILEGKQVAFKMWQMNVPKISDIIEISFYDYDILEHVRKVFKVAEGEVFLFRVESLVTKFDEGIEFDNDNGTEYIVNLTPVIS